MTNISPILEHLVVIGILVMSVLTSLVAALHLELLLKQRKVIKSSTGNGALEHLVLVTDNETGIQYVAAPWGGLCPRLKNQQGVAYRA
jgi:hypothetical protein